MIRSVSINTEMAGAGDNIQLLVDAAYPVTIEIYCFITEPKPPRFAPCPDAGKHTLNYQRSFIFRTDYRIVEGSVDIKIADADGDVRTFKIDIGSRPRQSIR